MSRSQILPSCPTRSRHRCLRWTAPRQGRWCWRTTPCARPQHRPLPPPGPGRRRSPPPPRRCVAGWADAAHRRSRWGRPAACRPAGPTHRRSTVRPAILRQVPPRPIPRRHRAAVRSARAEVGPTLTLLRGRGVLTPRRAQVPAGRRGATARDALRGGPAREGSPVTEGSPAREGIPATWGEGPPGKERGPMVGAAARQVHLVGVRPARWARWPMLSGRQLVGLAYGTRGTILAPPAATAWDWSAAPWRPRGRRAWSAPVLATFMGGSRRSMDITPRQGKGFVNSS